MQTLISQCLDHNFLNEIFSEAGKGGAGQQNWTMTISVLDDYFVSNIEKVDSVTLLRKDKLMTGTTWTLRFQHAITTWPNLNNLGWDMSQNFNYKIIKSFYPGLSPVPVQYVGPVRRREPRPCCRCSASLTTITPSLPSHLTKMPC